MDPYKVRFTFFWYNDEEIFHDTQEDIDRKVKAVADQGITHIITFSCTHFRWSFEPWWDKIHECLAKIVKAGHKYGLKVIEHHSSELAHYPYNEKYLTYMKNCLRGRHSSIDSWPGIVELALKEDGPALRWTQISHLTGKPNISNYCATNRCYNNPDYVKAYLSYLEKVYATGVDGIMTDDVQYFCHCQCEHCRRLFQENTSFTLPEAGTEDWEKWFGNMSDPSFLAWLKFRFDSTLNFHKKVAKHYEDLGLELLRPNYLSFGLTHDWTAFSLEKVPRLDWFFQECATACLVRYSLPKVLSEQSHRAMIAEKRKIPHGILFYAYNEDELLYTWGIAMLAGAFYINTPEGGRPVDENLIRSFEKRFGDTLFHGEKVGGVGFVDSPANRFFAPCYNMNRMEFFLQSCIFWNIPCRMVSILEPESWKNCSILSVNEVHCLRDEEIEELKAFAAGGKSLILSGPTGVQKGDHSPRSREELEKLWGFSLDMKEGERMKIIPHGKGKIALLALDYGYPGSPEEVEEMFGDPLRYGYGQQAGRCLKHLPFIVSPVSRRSGDIRTESPVKELYMGFLEKKEEVLTLFRELFAGEENFVAQLPEGILASAFIQEKGEGFSIRLLNIKGAMIPPGNGESISRFDPIPWEKWEEGEGTFLFRLSGEMAEKEYDAFFHTLTEPAVSLPVKKDGEKLLLTLSAGMLRDFALIVVSPKKG